jgi:hypothetical protein
MPRQKRNDRPILAAMKRLYLWNKSKSTSVNRRALLGIKITPRCDILIQKSDTLASVLE